MEPAQSLSFIFRIGVRAMYVLAVDGGGTKTSAVISDELGNIHAKLVTNRSNPTAMEMELFKATLHQLLQGLRAQNPHIFSAVRICFAGMAGVQEKKAETIVETIFREYVHSEAIVIIQNDALIALYAGTFGGEGIVQIAGTGAVTVGYDHTHSFYRVGGWGYLFDDEGSGYDLGVQALKAVFQSHDNRSRSTLLTDALLKHFAVNNVPELIDCIYGTKHPRTVIAPLSMYVMEAAELGDLAANIIRENSCSKLYHAIKTCYQQLSWKGQMVVPVVLTGGVLSNTSYFISKLTQLAINDQLPLQFLSPQLDPIGGAVIGALHTMGISVGDEFSAKFMEHYVKWGK